MTPVTVMGDDAPLAERVTPVFDEHVRVYTVGAASGVNASVCDADVVNATVIESLTVVTLVIVIGGRQPKHWSKPVRSAPGATATRSAPWAIGSGPPSGLLSSESGMFRHHTAEYVVVGSVGSVTIGPG